ncbi:MAG: antitoxin Xre-like helix-turn-helix domain-containing protein [Nevskiales bacterium]
MAHVAARIPEVNLASPHARASLARMVTRLFDHWDLDTDTQAALLGFTGTSRSTLSRYRNGQPVAPNRDLIERIGHLLAIHKSLRILYPYDRQLVYGWMLRANAALQGRTPAQVVRDDGFEGLLTVRRLLDVRRGH